MHVESDGTTYHLKYKKCGKKRCSNCMQGGPGHGPYWVSYQNGREKYIGTQLPISLQQSGRLHQRSLVGREKEMGQLRTAVEFVEMRRGAGARRRRESAPTATEQDSAQIVLLTGEVGIGKTRLAEEVAHEVLQRGWIVLWGRSYEQESVFPYRIWLDVLRAALSLHPDYQSKEGPSLQKYQPLTTLLLELREVFPQTMLATEWEPASLWEAAYSLLTTLCEQKPLLIVLDDLQWADERSTELLAYLGRRVSGSALLVLGTFRTTSPSPFTILFSQMQREGHTALLPVAPLSTEHIGTLVSSSVSLTESQISSIQSRAEGNPFFAEELARDAISAKGDDTFETTRGSLPMSIAILLEQRVEGISPACLSLLRNGAVLGGSFTFPIVYAMEGRAASSPASELTVLDLIEEALNARILTEEGNGKGVRYRFWHPLLANLLYENLSAYRRAGLHRRAADVLRSESVGSQEENAAAILHHLLNGDGADSKLVASYAKMAGDRAYALSAYGEAVKYYRVALEHFGNAREHTSYEEEGILLECLGECLRVQGEANDARSFYLRAVDVHLAQYRSADAQERKHIAQILALLYCDVGLTFFDASDSEQAMHSYRRGEHILTEAGITGGYAWGRVLYEESYAKWREGNYAEAYLLAQRTLDLFTHSLIEPSQQIAPLPLLNRTRRTLAGDATDVGRTHLLLGLIANGLGNMREALHHLTTALAVFERDDRPREIANVCCNLGDLYMRKAEYSQAQNVLQRSLLLAERIGDDPLVSFVSGNLGLLALRRGSLEKAEELFLRAIELAKRTGSQAAVGLWSNYVAVSLQEQGKLVDAGLMARFSLGVLRPLHITPYLGIALLTVGTLRVASVLVGGSPRTTGLAHREATLLLQKASKTLAHALSLREIEEETRLEVLLVQARIALFLGKIDEVARLAPRILEDAKQAELTWLIARAQCLQAEVRFQLGQREGATQLLEHAIDTFRVHGMLLELARALYQYAEMGARYSDSIGPTSHEKSTLRESSLQEAKQLFIQCTASLDLQIIERTLEDGEGARTPVQ